MRCFQQMEDGTFTSRLVACVCSAFICWHQVIEFVALMLFEHIQRVLFVPIVHQTAAKLPRGGSTPGEGAHAYNPLLS